MSAKYTSKKGKPAKRSNFQKLVDVLKNRSRTKTTAMSKKYYNSFRITHDAYQRFYDGLPKATEGLDDLNRRLQDLATNKNPSFSLYSRMFKKWNETYRDENDHFHPHHKEFSNVATQLRLIYEALLQMQADMTQIYFQSSQFEFKFQNDLCVNIFCFDL